MILAPNLTIDRPCFSVEKAPNKKGRLFWNEEEEKNVFWMFFLFSFFLFQEKMPFHNPEHSCPTKREVGGTADFATEFRDVSWWVLCISKCLSKDHLWCISWFLELVDILLWKCSTWMYTNVHDLHLFRSNIIMYYIYIQYICVCNVMWCNGM